MSDQSPKPRPYNKPTVVDENTESPRPKPKREGPFVPRPMKPLRNHDGLKGLLQQLGGLPKSANRPRRKS